MPCLGADLMYSARLRALPHPEFATGDHMLNDPLVGIVTSGSHLRSGVRAVLSPRGRSGSWRFVTGRSLSERSSRPTLSHYLGTISTVFYDAVADITSIGTYYTYSGYSSNPGLCHSNPERSHLGVNDVEGFFRRLTFQHGLDFLPRHHVDLLQVGHSSYEY